MTENVHLRALAALASRVVDDKLSLTRQLHADCLANNLRPDRDTPKPTAIIEPGQPDRPLLVTPTAVEHRHLQSPSSHVALIRSLTHIEFNAINLALHAAYRLRGLPAHFLADRICVAAEEARHFCLLPEHLGELGFGYGDFSAHNGLWEMAVKTAHDLLVRMALVPRVLEARGLDASRAPMRRLTACGGTLAGEILAEILHDEISHFRIGNNWYEQFCAQRSLDPIVTFRRLLTQYDAPRVRPPFHE